MQRKCSKAVSLTVSPGEMIDIQCKASSSVSNEMQFYVFNQGQTPKLLICDGNSCFIGVPTGSVAAIAALTSPSPSAGYMWKTLVTITVGRTTASLSQ